MLKGNPQPSAAVAASYLGKLFGVKHWKTAEAWDFFLTWCWYSGESKWKPRVQLICLSAGATGHATALLSDDQFCVGSSTEIQTSCLRRGRGKEKEKCQLELSVNGQDDWPHSPCNRSFLNGQVEGFFFFFCNHNCNLYIYWYFICFKTWKECKLWFTIGARRKDIHFQQRQKLT